MTYLVAGLLIFLGIHSSRVFADDWRARWRTRVGPLPWKAFYSLVSLLGVVLVVWGYGQARQAGVVLWTPPVATRHVAALLMLLSFVLLVAAYVPGNSLKARLHHPMVLATKTWALAHLLANGGLADVVLFGSFLVWSVVLFASSRRRDRREGTRYRPGRLMPTLITLVIGAAAWAGFAFYLHARWIGVHPFA